MVMGVQRVAEGHARALQKVSGACMAGDAITLDDHDSPRWTDAPVIQSFTRCWSVCHVWHGGERGD